MARLLRMPGVSADSDEAALEGWTVEVGATLASGDTIASVETEKAVVDIDVDEDSIVHALLVDSGAMVPVGDPIAVLLAPGEPASAGEELVRELSGGTDPTLSSSADAAAAVAAEADAGGAVTGLPEAEEVETVEGVVPVEAPAQTPAAEPVAAPAATPAPAEPARPATASGGGQDASDEAPAGPAPDAGTGERRFASPLARRLAKELGVDIASLTGSGPGGRIVRDDVKAAAESGPAPAQRTTEAPAAAAPSPAAPAASAGSVPAPAAKTPSLPEGATSEPHSRLRKLIASRLQESKRTAPHFYLTKHLDVTALLELRAQVNAQSSVRVSVNDFFVKAAARALIDVPEMNVIWTDEAVVSFPTADVSVAVASERGLVTPTIRGIESLSLSSLSSKIKDAVSRANAGKLQQSELEGGTLSISNLGMFGVDEFAAIINPPQAAILAIGAARRQPVFAEDGSVVPADIVTVTLSVDHRPVDGAIAARWLARLAELVENPMQILL
ncbi:2-oxo acid dehydrogenase subunit E2 [Humibacter sp. BT305]|nr:2-oxo acid dehydrogenase subunit E2 [Humibacter sp. BT305]